MAFFDHFLHGAGHRGQRLARLPPGPGPLRAAGHEVFTPSLTGIGERAHLTSPEAVP